MEKILWGTKIGDPDYAEQVIVETESETILTKAAKWAETNGFDRLRVMKYNGEAPDFAEVAP